MSSSEKKEGAGTQATKFFVRKYDIFSMKRVTRKFHVLVIQNNVQKVCCTCKVCFFLGSHCHRCLALHDFIFCLRKVINESFAFSPG